MKDFMNEAIKEALKAEQQDEIPIGAVIVVDDKIVARGHNTREKSQNALNHAETIAINKACKKLKSWRLENATIYGVRIQKGSGNYLYYTTPANSFDILEIVKENTVNRLKRSGYPYEQIMKIL